MITPRNFWPYGIIAAFVLFLVGTAALIVIAATHRDSLVSSDYYDREIRFQNHLDSAARARQSGATVTFDAAARRIGISLPAAQISQSLSGQIELYRPSAAGLDRQFKLQPDANGVQWLDVTGLPAGPWEVRVAWNAGGQDYFLGQKIIIAADNAK
jgi:hypothetical protein